MPASEKIVSIFEPHTDIIIKDRRETLYGHKVCRPRALRLVTNVIVEHGNPADSTLAVKMIKRQSELCGQAPRQMCFDGGFSSKANLAELKALGVQDVAFSKHVGLSISDMVKSTWVYRRLRNFERESKGSSPFSSELSASIAASGVASGRSTHTSVGL